MAKPVQDRTKVLRVAVDEIGSCFVLKLADSFSKGRTLGDGQSNHTPGHLAGLRRLNKADWKKTAALEAESVAWSWKPGKIVGKMEYGSEQTLPPTLRCIQLVDLDIFLETHPFDAAEMV